MDNSKPGRFLISYDHEAENPSHRADVLALCGLLRAADLDVHVDADAEGERQDWSLWMTREIAAADRVLMVVSPRYRDRFVAEAPTGSGRGVEFEAKLIREEIGRDPAGSLRKFVPVVLPGRTRADIPALLQPYTATYWSVPSLTPDGVAKLVRLLRKEPGAPCPAPARAESDRTGALWLAVAGGSSAAVDDVVAAFVAGDATTAVTPFAAGDGGTALRTGTPHGIVAQLLRLDRTLHPLLGRCRRAGSAPVVTVGAHVADGPVAAAAGAQWVSAARVVERLHAEPRVTAVFAVSPAFHALLGSTPGAAVDAYTEFRRDGAVGDPVHLSAPGLGYCPELLPDPGPPPRSAPGGPRLTAVGDRARINYNSVDNSIDNSDTIHIVAGNVTVHRGAR